MSHAHRMQTKKKDSAIKADQHHDISHDVIMEDSTQRENSDVENYQDGAMAMENSEDILIVTKPGEDGNTIEFHKNDSRPTFSQENSNFLEPSAPPASQQGFSLKSFPEDVADLTHLFSADRFNQIGADYPIEEVANAVRCISELLGEYKSYTLTSQENLEALRKQLTAIRDKIHLSVKRRAFDLDPDDKYQSEEEIALTEKLSRLNADLSRANVELAEVVKLAAETETTAIRAAQVAQESNEEARRVKYEMEARAAIEAQKRREEDERLAEEKRLREEQERKAAETKRQRELEWKKHEAPAIVDSLSYLPLYPFESPMGSEFSIYCVVRASSSKFDASSVSCDPVDQSDVNFVYGAHEELVSPIIQLSAESDLREPVSVCIPFIKSRLTALSREALIKAWDGNCWNEMYTKEVNLDSYKEYKFAQAEMRSWCTLAVVTRLKRDYITVDTHQPTRITSSADHRVTITVLRDGITKREHLIMQVQPIDSATIQEVKAHKNLKNLLTSSPMVFTEWKDGGNLKQPITITVPCPPNPAKAKKMAAIRAQKEAKLNNPPKDGVLMDESERLKAERAKKRCQALAVASEGEVVKKRETRWYMGVYGASEDDESDQLVLLQGYTTGRWSVCRDVAIQQVRVDLLQFDAPHMMDKFIVLRTRVSVEENDDDIITMATAIDEHMEKRSVNIIVKQRSSDTFDTALHIVPTRKVERTLQALEAEKYTGGPPISRDLFIKEGDIIDIEFHGNITPTSMLPSPLIYNSHISTTIAFTLAEVDQYLQKDFNAYHGLIQVYRKFKATKTQQNAKIDQKARLRKLSLAAHMVAPPTEEEERPIISEYQREFLCDMPIHIPKYHIEASTAAYQVPVLIDTSDTVNETTLRRVSAELGDEWKRLAHLLNVHRTRVQAIVRNSVVGDTGMEEARYNMLVTWWKRLPRASNKAEMLSRSLEKCGRYDLASEVRLSDKNRRDSQLLQLAA